MTRIFSIIISGILLLAGCTGNSQSHPTPRRTAYPRPALPDTAMSVPPEAPLKFKVNDDAVITSPRDGWLNINYPTLGAVIYITFSPVEPATIDATRANRMERLLLNSGDRPSEHSEFTSRGGFSCLVARTEGATTPLQFLAADSSKWVVSGAVYFADPSATTATDSIRPILNAIERDVIESLKDLSAK